MTDPKDPQVHAPDRPDPTEDDARRPTSAPPKSTGATEAERTEANEPTENRFPDEPDSHQESG